MRKQRMNSKLYLLWMLNLLAGIFTVNAQTDTSWIRHYVNDSVVSYFPSGIEQCGDDAVLVIGSASHVDDPPDNRSALVRIDGENGDILWQTRLVHNPVAEASQAFFFIRGLIRLLDGSFIVVVNTITEKGNTGFAVHRIADDGSVLWHKDYGIDGQEILANATGLGIGPDSMSFVVTARRLDIGNPSNTLLLYYIDAAGGVVHDLNLTTNLGFYAEDSPVAMLNDSSFVVGFNLGNFDLKGTKLLRHIRYSGETLTTHTAWDFGWWADLKRHPSGQLVAISQANTGESENSDKHGLRTTLYTNTLDTVWSRIYNHIPGPLFYREFEIPGPASFDPQGNILSMGDGSAFDGIRPAHFVLYNIDGDRLWTKRIGFGEEVGGYLQSISGKIAFHPNGILLAGSNIQNGILLARLDSAGCLIEHPCDTDIILDTEGESENAMLNFQVFPNPAMDQVAISLSADLFKSLTKPTIHILDLMGRKLISSAILESQYQLQVKPLPSGMYVVLLESRGYAVGIQRLFKW